MTSPDGITWTSRTSAADSDWYSVIYGNDRFVAVASFGAGIQVMISVGASPGAPTTTTLAASLNPSTVGASVTFTATVAPSAATGTVTFKDGTTTLGTGTLSGGTATYTTAALTVGAHSITAEYGGDSGYLGSTNSPALAQTVNSAGPAAHTAINNGLWSDPNTWSDGVVPAAGEDVVIPASFTVTLDINTAAIRNLSLAGTLTVPGTQALTLSGNYTNTGMFTPGTGTVELTGGSNQVLAATAPGTLTFYRLTVNKDPATAKVTATSKLKATKKLTLTSGKLVSGSDYGDIEIGMDGELQLTSDITISGDFINWGTLTTDGHGITFDGGVAQDLTLINLTTFDDLTVAAGTTLIETESDDNALVNGTLLNQGVIRKTQPVSGIEAYYFGLAGRYNSADMEINVTALTGPNPLTALQVDRIDANHPNAPGTNTTSIYWTITPTGLDFVADLTLPQAGLATPQACRYTNPGWDGAANSFTATTVTRTGITEFSDWAVFNNTATGEYVDGYVYQDNLTNGTVGLYDAGIDTPLTNITVYVTNHLLGLVTVSTDSGGYFQAFVPPGSAVVNVDTNGVDFPPGLVLTSVPDGQNPSAVTVPPGGSVRDNTGYRRPAVTLASILSVTARAQAGVVTVRWVTAAEVGTVSYDLQRQLPDGAWMTVNADSVFAWNSLTGASYSVPDANARARQSYHYQILEYLEHGETKLHGPYAVTVTGEPGVPVALSAVALAAGQLQLTWAGEAGATYLLERSARLDPDAEWTRVPLTAPTETSALVPVEDDAGFFRVFRLP
jgi:hypothetical protein